MRRSMTDSRSSSITRNRIIDLLMVLFLMLLMTYSLIGETFHEIAGTAMLILFLAHNWMHRKWWKAIAKGRYTPYRILITVVNVVLFALMLSQPLAGIAMSHHLYTFLSFLGLSSLAREIHLAVAYWCFALMSFHLGLHMDAVLRSILRGKEKQAAVRWLGRLLALSISAYGAFAFVRRGFPDYMFRRTRFAFFDYSEPIAFFLADYLAIMTLFATCGYYSGKLALRMRPKGKAQ